MVGDRRRTRQVLRHLARVALLLTLVGLVGLVGACSRQDTDRSSDVGPVPTLSKDDLERAKLAAETRAAQQKAERDSSWSAALLQWAPFVTALVAVAGVGMTLRTQRKDRQVERRKRHDEELARTVANLGSDAVKVRLNSAAALTAFLGPDSPDLQLDLLTVIIANLKVESETPVAEVLVADLEIALRESFRAGRHIKELDLARSPWLVRLDLSGVDLTGIPVDLAFANLTRANLSAVTAPRTVRAWGAVLDDARLSRANLHQARFNTASCLRTRFHGTRLVSATFKDCDLRGAQFYQAGLQGAHFERARLEGAVFVEADLTDTWFCDSRNANAAVLDDGALRTMARARERSWQRAHLTPVHRAAVEVYAGATTAIPKLAARLVRQGSLAEAQRWYQRALDADVPLHAGALRKLGLALLADEQGQAARRWLSTAAHMGDPVAAEALKGAGPGPAVGGR